MKNFIFGLFLILLLSCSSHKVEKPVAEKETQSFRLPLWNQEKIRFSETYFLLAEAALAEGDLERAIQYYIYADRENHDNFIIKATLLELLDKLSQEDERFLEIIFEFSETFYPNGTYNAYILKLLAKAYGRDEQYEPMKKAMEKVVELEPNRKNYIIFYSMLAYYFEETEPSLLLQALEYEQQEEVDDEFLETIITGLKDSNPEKVSELLQTNYQKTKEEDDLLTLLRFWEAISEYEKISDLLSSHLQEFPDSSEHLKSYFILQLFWQQKFDAILEWQEICWEIGTADILKPLFLAALRSENFSFAEQVGKAIMETSGFEPENESLFFSFVSEMYFYREDETNYFKYLQKITNSNHVLKLYVSLDEKLKEEPTDRERLRDMIEQAANLDDESERFRLAALLFYGQAGKIEKMNEYMDVIPFTYLIKEEVADIVILLYLENAQNLKKAKQYIALIEDELPVDERIFYYFQAMNDKGLALELVIQELRSQEKPSSNSFQVAANMIEEQEEIEILFTILEWAAELYPEDPIILNYLGYSIALYEKEEDYERAEYLLTKAHKLMPDSIAISDSLAWLYYKLGKYLQAKDIVEKFEQEDIVFSEIAYHAGKIYYQLNQYDVAAVFFQKAISLDNDEKYVEFSKEFLTKMKP